MLSVVIPAYNEQDNICAAAAAIGGLLDSEGIAHELLFVNDGSTDETWRRVKQLAVEKSDVKAICLSRNFGKESAIFAGLENACGDVCAIMDCDLQHPPATLVEMYRLWENNPEVDVVEAKKRDRGKENPLYRFCAQTFYKVIENVSGLDMSDASDFKLLDRRAADALLSMPERLTFFRAMSSWVGFNSEIVYFDVGERKTGESKFTAKVSINYAIRSITAFTSSPMQLVTVMGVITFLIAIVFGINTLYNKIMGRAADGFTTVILLLLITSAIIMFSLGIIGYYLSKIYEELKQRPRYIVSEKINFTAKEKSDGNK